jgi:hypothetical protein
MKKFACFAAVLLLASVAAFPVQLSFKVNGGMNFLNGNDYNKGVVGLMSYMNDTYANVSGEIWKMRNAISFQGELIFSFSPRFGLGIGAGYYGLNRNDTVTYDSSGLSGEINYSPKLSAIPVFLNFHYFLQAADKLKIDLYAGPVLVISSLKWTDSDVWALWNLAHTFEASGIAFGGQAGLGLDFQVAPRISLVLDVMYRLASWSEVKGPWTEDGTFLIWTVNTDVDEAFLWSYQLRSGSKRYDMVGIAEAGPSGADYTNVKKSPLQMGGLAASFGIKIGL